MSSCIHIPIRRFSRPLVDRPPHSTHHGIGNRRIRTDDPRGGGAILRTHAIRFVSPLVGCPRTALRPLRPPCLVAAPDVSEWLACTASLANLCHVRALRLILLRSAAALMCVMVVYAVTNMKVIGTATYRPIQKDSSTVKI
jgi:hypothetical protein